MQLNYCVIASSLLRSLTVAPKSYLWCFWSRLNLHGWLKNRSFFTHNIMRASVLASSLCDCLNDCRLRWCTSIARVTTRLWVLVTKRSNMYHEWLCYRECHVCYFPNSMQCWDMFSQHEMRSVCERENMRTNEPMSTSLPTPQSPYALLIGEIKGLFTMSKLLLTNYYTYRVYNLRSITDYYNVEPPLICTNEPQTHATISMQCHMSRSLNTFTWLVVHLYSLHPMLFCEKFSPYCGDTFAIPKRINNDFRPVMQRSPQTYVQSRQSLSNPWWSPQLLRTKPSTQWRLVVLNM
jgi:hypothetical protein